MSEQRVFLGWVDEAKIQPNPLTMEVDGHLAAAWSYGPGSAPHLRMVGTTGGGKSSLLRRLILGLVRLPGPRGICIIDGEGAGEFTMFEGARGIAKVVNVNPAADAKLPDGELTSVELAAETISAALDESVERNETMMRTQATWAAHLADPRNPAPTYRPPAELFLVIDGWTSLCYILGHYLRAKIDPVEDAIQIGRNGRKVDVHLVIASQVMYAQRSKGDVGMPSELKKQLGCAVAAVGPLGMTNTEASMCFDDPDAGRHVPRELGGCLMQVGATRLPFVAPELVNMTSADPSVTLARRQAVRRLLPSRGSVA